MKRFLGFVLALSMIIAMIPAVAAEGETSTTGLTLNYNIRSVLDTFDPKWQEVTNPRLSVLNYESTKGFFEFYDAYSHRWTVGEVDGDNLDTLKYRSNGMIQIKGVHVAFKVYIPYVGTYTMKMYNALSSDKIASNVNVYVNKDKSSIENGLVGSYNCQSSSGDASTPITEPNEIENIVISEPGEYVFTFYTWDLGTIGDFELVCENAPSDTYLMSPNLTISGGKAQVAGLWDSDGAAVSLDGATITYASSNQDIATIDATTGVITDKAVGTTDITATVTINGATITATEKYTVTDGVTIKYDLAKVMQEQNMSYGATDKPLSLINDDNTKGFFRIFEVKDYSTDTIVENPADNKDTIKYRPTGIQFYRRHIAFEVHIPRAGEYTMKMYNGTSGSQNRTVEVFVKKGAASIDPADKVGSYNTGAPDGNSYNTVATPANVMENKVKITEPGDYVFTFYCYYEGAVGSFELVDGLGTMVVPMSVKLGDVTDGTAEISKVVMSDGTTTADGATVTYTSSNTDVATVDAQSGAITKVREGKTDITVSVTRGDVTVTDTVAYTVEADTALKDAFDAEPTVEEDYIAPSVTGITEDGVITAQPNADGSYNLTAPDADAENKFLYWAMGMGTNKRIVSFDATLKNYVPQGNNVNYLVPVYEDDITDKETPEYYNINGELIAKQATAPTTMPSIPGLGKAKGWVNCGGNIWVAEYEKTAPEATIEITAGEYCSLNKTDKYAYGEEVVCTANGTGTFKCWKKTLDDDTTEIVSVDPTYTFHAWENCTVTAVYDEHIPVATAMKIIIDDFDIDGDTGVMAEFIGLGNAVEKGIMFTATGETEARKIAMTTKDNQFTVVADKPGTYVGYAILKSGDVYNIITDGSYTK